MIDTPPLRGLWCALLTPVDGGGGVDHGRFAAHARRLLERGVDGVMPFGTMGEGPSFPVAERMAGLEGLRAAGIPAHRLLAATGCAALTDTLALTRHALASGVGRCLVLPPFFWKGLPDDALFRYYADVIEGVGDDRLRVYLYHIPQVSGVAIGAEVLARLAAAYPVQVAGLKDSGGDYAQTARFLAAAPGLSILVGHEPDLPRLMREGGAGSIGGIANLWPEAVAALLKPGVGAGDQKRIRDFLEIVSSHPFLPACKALLAAQTGDPGWLAPRPPLYPLPEPGRRGLLSELGAAGCGFPPP